MPIDPPENFDPIAAQHAANVALLGFSHGGQVAEQLEREQAAVEMRHDAQPGGGVRVLRIEDASVVRDVLLDRDSRLRSLSEGVAPPPTTDVEVEKPETLYVTRSGSVMPALPDRGW